MFREICRFIEQETGMALGGRLRYGWRTQDAPDRCVLIAETAGGAVVGELGDRADLQIQALARAPEYDEARDDIYAVFEALHGRAGHNLPRLDGSGPDYLAMTIDALAAPQYLGVDEKRRHEFSCNFIFRMEEGACGTAESGSL